MRPPGTPSLPDAVRGHWADRLAPAGLRPYLRLARIERPIGWWLLLLPCWWSAALAAIAAGQPWPDPLHCVLFLIGAVAMRGAGCTYNDIVDRDLDMKVERTRQRPLPSGQVSVKGALAFLVLLALIGLGGAPAVQRFRHPHGLRIARDRRALSVHEALLLDAADRAGPGLCLGRPDGMGRRLRLLERTRPSCFMRAASRGWSGTTPSTRCRTSRTTRWWASSPRRGSSASRSGWASGICYALTILFLTGRSLSRRCGLDRLCGPRALRPPSRLAGRADRP